MGQNYLIIAYLIASVLFIVGLKMLSNPTSARAGNLWAAFGMGLAIFTTIFLYDPSALSSFKLTLIFSAIVIGTITGFIVAKKVQMTQMPEMVSLFNGMGGACAALISLVEYPHSIGNSNTIAIIMAGLIIGSISFSGSMVAFAKLNGTLSKSIRMPGYNIINNIVLLAILSFAVFITMNGGHSLAPLYIIFAAALLYGIMFVVPIGGADMPVVISLLNSFTGLAAAFGGFLYDNQVMLTGGILVGSAGTILTLIMCKAMNRSLAAVVFGGFSESGEASIGNDANGSIKDTTVTDAAILMNYSKKVIIVPGYGLAVAQAQHVVHELEEALMEKGVEVKYAIHPVAGRMPGHMNVLLAESNVDYDKLAEMEDINPEFNTTDVVLVIGANDVVNPAAKSDPASPIYGMPILDVENAKHVIVNKRSMNVGYAGIDNALFYNQNTSMLFGDAKKVLSELVAEVNSM